MGPDDLSLIERCLAGDEEAFGVLLRRHQDTVYSLVRRMVGNAEDAGEITQDAFVRAFRALPRYDPQFAFRGWILKIASNLAIDFLRRRKIPTVSLDAPLELAKGQVPRDVPSRTEAPDEVAAGHEVAAVVEEALTRLSPAHRQVILLLYQERMSYEEIGALLGEPLGTIKARIHRARQALRQLVAPYLHEEGLE